MAPPDGGRAASGAHTQHADDAASPRATRRRAQQKKDCETIWQFLCIATLGPAHLRLCDDVRRQVHAHFLDATRERGPPAQHPAWKRPLLACRACAECVLAEDEGGHMVQVHTYFVISDEYLCARCLPSVLPARPLEDQAA